MGCGQLLKYTNTSNLCLVLSLSTSHGVLLCSCVSKRMTHSQTHSFPLWYLSDVIDPHSPLWIARCHLPAPWCPPDPVQGTWPLHSHTCGGNLVKIMKTWWMSCYAKDYSLKTGKKPFLTHFCSVLTITTISSIEMLETKLSDQLPPKATVIERERNSLFFHVFKT